ncbi:MULTISPECIES: hypothetical protein [Clavibacter]|uniref:hypothetical protein n=1 Tax=Clavibacter TaxID=1573 RepID=UPI000A8E59B3|nr:MULTISPECIES: hypothetical protein [Clavibacter]MDA3804815.1 hypothetical protein [Clavibacter sp. CT19]
MGAGDTDEVEGGFRWEAPAWLCAGIFAPFGLAGLGWAAVRGIRLRRRARG